MPFLSHAGHSLRYERVGSGLPLLFIHGLLANHTFWERQLSLRKDFQLLRMDLRGHGDSSKPRGAYGMATLATDVEHLVSGLGLQRCVLVGWSMGGAVAVEASRVLGERLAGLVLVGTTPCASAAPGYPHGFSAEERQQHLAAVDADYRSFARDLAGRTFHHKEQAAALLPWATQQFLRTPPYVAKAALEGLLAADERTALAAVTVPTLICHGRHDTIFPFAGAEHMRKILPGSELLAFEESGHAPMIEETERFNDALRAFADRLLGRAPAAGASPPPSTQPTRSKAPPRAAGHGQVSKKKDGTTSRPQPAAKKPARRPAKKG
jgi:pimeloyl-ACP methyl ester carboxylesterase